LRVNQSFSDYIVLIRNSVNSIRTQKYALKIPYYYLFKSHHEHLPREFVYFFAIKIERLSLWSRNVPLSGNFSFINEQKSESPLTRIPRVKIDCRGGEQIYSIFIIFADEKLLQSCDIEAEIYSGFILYAGRISRLDPLLSEAMFFDE
jgi:hypothetical protein